MTIYYSNFSNADLKHQTLEVLDYNNLAETKAAQTSETEREDFSKSSNKDKELYN